jgi:hypothetical protein
MSFAKLSDDFADDCWTLSDAAVRLHVEGLCWNGRKLLDCRIPKDDLRRLAKRPEAVAELLAAGWWADDGDGYLIRHHATYQRSRDQVLHQQQVNRENALKGGRPPKPPRERAAEIRPPQTDSVSGSLSERDRTGQARKGSEVRERETDRERQTHIHHEEGEVTPEHDTEPAPASEQQACADCGRADAPQLLGCADGRVRCRRCWAIAREAS